MSNGPYKKINMHVGPVLMPAKLVARALCACNYSFLRPETPMGKEYQVDLKSVRWAKFQCQGCGKKQHFRMIDVWSEITLMPSWFALDLLDIGEAIAHAPKPDEKDFHWKRKPS